MSSRMARRAVFVAGPAVVALLAALSPQVAFASPLEAAPPTSTGTSAPMTVVGYNSEVAEANGYRIVTDADGSRASVPVTDKAKAQQAAADAARAVTSVGEVSARGVADGDCGSSFINAVKQANDTVAYSTGYVVFGAVVDAQWTIAANGFISGNSVTLHPGASAGTWSTEGGITGVVGPGVAGVSTTGSFAVLAGGQVCYSEGPTATFG